MSARALVLAPLACLCLGVGLAAQEGWDELAAAGAWAELAEQTRIALDEAPGEESRFWLGRAEVEQARGLPAGGTSGHFRRRLLESGAAHLKAVAEGDGPRADEALEAWLTAAWAWGAPGPSASEREAGWQADGRPAWAWAHGLYALDAGDPETALTWFDRAAARWTDRGDLQLARAEALGGVGRRDEALAAWSRATRGRFPSVVPRDTLLEVVVHLLPEATDAELRLARLDELAEQDSWRSDAWLAWHRAFALGQLGRTDEAVRVFAQGTEGRTPRIERAHALVLARTGRAREAVAMLRPLAEERDWDAYADLVTVADELAQARSWDEALWAYDIAVGIEPRDERALRNRAITLWRTGRDDRAAQAWRQVLEVLPRRSDLLNDAALAALGRAEPDAAHELLDQAVTLPGSIDARENLAVLLLDERREPERARELIDSVLAEEPDRPRALRLALLSRLDRAGAR